MKNNFKHICGRSKNFILYVTLCLGILLSLSTVVADEKLKIFNKQFLKYYHVGDYSEAMVWAEKALDYSQAHLGKNHPDTLTSMSNRALTYYQQGYYDKAETIYLKSLSLMKDVLGRKHPNTLLNMNNLALLYVSQGRYDEAESIYIKSLGLMREVLGENHPDTLLNISNLAALYASQGRYDEAELLYLNTLELRKEVLGEKHPDTLISMNNLAELYFSQGRYDQAETLYIKSMALMNVVLGKKHPYTLKIMNNLASLYQSQGRYDEAESQYIKSLELMNEVLGDKHPDTLLCINNLAHLYHSQSRYDEAEPLFLKTLEIRNKTLGEKHPHTLVNMNNLAALYKSQGRYDEAEPIYIKTLKLRNEVLGEKHPETITSMNNLANLYHSQGRYEEAEPLYIRKLSLSKEVLGGKHPETLKSMNNLAYLYHSQGHYDVAEPIYIKTLGLRKDVLGRKHPDTLSSMNNLALLYYAQGRYKDAEAIFFKTIAIKNEILGELHPNTLISKNNLASIFASQGKYDKAESLHLKTLAQLKKSVGEKHPNTIMSINNLASLYIKLGRSEEAESLYLKVLHLNTEVLGEKHPSTLTSLNNLAHFNYFKSRYDEAESLYLKALGHMKSVLGENHPNTLLSLNNLAILYYYQGRYDDVEAIFDKELQATQQFLTQMLWASGVDTQQSYIQQLKYRSDFYLTLFSHRNSDDNARKALNLSLNRKALLLQISTQIRALERSSQDPDLSELAYSLKTNRQRLSTLIQKHQADQPEIDALEESINQQQAQLGRYVQQLSPERSSVTPDQVIKALDEQSVFIDYMIYHPVVRPDEKIKPGAYLLALVVTNDPKHPIHLIELGEMTPIEQAINQYRKLLGQSRSLTADGIAIAQQLYRSLWAPLLPYLTEKRQAYVAADGILNLLPFTSLIDSDQRYLIKQYQVMMLSSGRDLVVPPLQAQVTDPVVFAAPLYDPEQAEQYASIEDARQATTAARELASLYFNPLPGTLREGDELIKLLKDTKQTVSYYKLDTATEQNLESVVSPRILHIATHGYFLEDVPDIVDTQPMQSSDLLSVQGEIPGLSKLPPHVDNPLLRAGLALVDANLAIKSDTEVEHGILTALEVLDLQLAGTELVILSACDTGVGEIRTGEGIYGLRRAFQEAGAQYVLATLWSISDEGTQAFMGRFYQRYLSGVPPQQSLRDTQLEFIQGIKWSHPYYWAAFVIMGK